MGKKYIYKIKQVKLWIIFFFLNGMSYTNLYTLIIAIRVIGWYFFIFQLVVLGYIKYIYIYNFIPYFSLPHKNFSENNYMYICTNVHLKSCLSVKDKHLLFKEGYDQQWQQFTEGCLYFAFYACIFEDGFIWTIS